MIAAIGQTLMTYGDYRETAEDAAWLAADVARVAEAVSTGEPIEDALIDTGYVPPMEAGHPEHTRMVAVAGAIRRRLGLEASA